MCALTSERVIEVVCKELSLTKEEVISHNRERRIVDARKMIAYVLRNHFDFTLTEISKLFNHKDHSVVFRYLIVTEDLIFTNKIFRDNILEIERKILKENDTRG